jgi:hypothetical protein
MPDNQKIDNSKLETLLDEFAQDRQKEKYAKVMDVLERSVIMVPTMKPQNLDAETEQEMVAGKPVQLPKDAKIQPCLLRKESGEMALPIFTSPAQIPQDKKSPAVLAMPFFAMINMVTANWEKLEAVVVNPFSHSMVLNKSILEVAQKRKDALGKAQTKTIKVTEKQFQEMAHNRVVLYLLPKYLFEHGEEGLQKLQKDEGEFLMNFYDEVYPEGKKPAFKSDNFSIMTMNVSETMQLTRVDMPDEAMKKGMCYRSYAVFKRDRNEITYYTMEKTEQGNFIGRVQADGKHELIEPAPDNGAEIEAVMNLAEKE